MYILYYTILFFYVTVPINDKIFDLLFIANANTNANELLQPMDPVDLPFCVLCARSHAVTYSVFEWAFDNCIHK